MQTNNQNSKVYTGNASLDALSYNGDNGEYIKFFKKGVRYVSPSEKYQYQGRILPAHDLNINPSSPEFATSYSGFRVCKTSEVKDNSDLDQTRNVPRPTNWFVGMAGYKMFGNLKADILSPMTKRAYPGMNAMSKEDFADPINDIFMLARNHPTYQVLTKNGTAKQAPTIPKSRTFAVMNVFARRDQSKPLENQLMLIPKSGLDAMLNRLVWPTIYGQTPRDINWPEFMYGDITHPTTGLWFVSCLEPSGTFTTNTLAFSTQPNSLVGSTVYPVDNNVLQSRQVLDHNLFEWLTYQQIVDLLVEDGSIPHELITQACQHLANIPAGQSRGAVYSYPTQPSPTANVPNNNVVNTAASAVFAPPPQMTYTAPQAPVAPQPAAVAAPQPPPAPPQMAAAPEATIQHPKYWVAVVGSQEPPVLLSAPDAKLKLHNSGENTRFMDEAGGEWKTPQQMGWVKPPVAPAAPKPPQAPVVEEISATIKTETATVPLGKEYSSSGDQLTDAEISEVKTLREKMHLNSAPPAMEEITRLMSLESRARKHGQVLA